MKSGNIWEEFEWPVMSDYEWRDTPVGIVLGATPRAHAVRRYRPLARQSSGLFHEFAALDRTPDAVLTFARRHGKLGAPVERFLAGDQLWPEDRTVYPTSGIAAEGLRALGDDNIVEPFDTAPEPNSINWCWKAQIELMADFVAWIRETPPQYSDLLHQAGEEMGSIVRNIRINQILGATVAPHLRPSGKRAFTLRFEPKSLIGAMWLQAAQAASEGVAFRKCEACGRAIAIARTTGARSDAKFCSDACKSRGYRQRRSRTLALAEKGWKAGRIAKELGTTTAVVRGWLR